MTFLLINSKWIVFRHVCNFLVTLPFIYFSYGCIHSKQHICAVCTVEYLKSKHFCINSNVFFKQCTLCGMVLMFSYSPFNLKPVCGAFGAEDVRIMLIEMVTRLAKLQIVALPTPSNPIERQRSPTLPQNCIRAKLHPWKSIFAFYL